MGQNELKLIITTDANGGITGVKSFSNALQDTETQAGKTATSLDNVRGVVEKLAAAVGLYKIGQFIESSTMLTARNETLGIVMRRLGENIGYTDEQMQGHAQGVAKMGITIEASRQSIVRMVEAQLDLRKSSELARVAQDAAVIANTNSSEAFDNMVTGIATGQAIILHHMGLMVDFEGAEVARARALGKTSQELTGVEKAQIRLDETLRVGGQIAGSYEAAMGTVGKQINSLRRYIDDNKAAFGELFTQALGVVVREFTEDLKKLGNWFLQNKDGVREFASALADNVVSGIKLAKDGITELKPIASEFIDLLKWMVDNKELVATAFVMWESDKIVTGLTFALNTFRLIRVELEAMAGLGIWNSLKMLGSMGGSAISGAMMANPAGMIVGAGIAGAGVGMWADNKWGEGAAAKRLAEQVAADQKEQAELNRHLNEMRETRRNHEAAIAGEESKRTRDHEAMIKAQAELDKKLGEERLKLSEAQMKNEVDLAKKWGEVKLQDLEYAHSQGILDDQQYHSKVMESLGRNFALELDMYQKQYKTIDDLFWQENDPKKQMELQKQKVDVEKQINDTAMEYIKKRQKFNQDAIQNEIKAWETYRQALVSVYDDATAKAQSFYDIAKKAGDIAQSARDWLASRSQKAMTPDEQMRADWKSVQSQYSSNINSNDLDKTKATIESLQKFYDKYYGQRDSSGFSFNFETSKVKSQVEELANQLDNIKASAEADGTAWEQFAAKQITAIQSVDQWVQYLKTGITDIAAYLAKSYTFTADFATAISGADAMVAKLQTAASYMGNLGGGTNYAGSKGGGTIQYTAGSDTPGGGAPIELPGAADGGYFTKPTIIAIAEKEPEYAIPASKMQSMQGGSTTIKIDLGGITIQGTTDPDTLARQIVKPIRDELVRLQYLSGGKR